MNSVAELSPPAASPAIPVERRRELTIVIGSTYIAYATSMLLRMIPTVAGNAIRAEASLGIDLDTWGKVLAAGTCGALTGKFLCGWAADRFGGKRTFATALFIASLFVGLFSVSSSLMMFQATFFVTLMAQAAGWPSMTKIVVNWVEPKHYGRVWGILSTSSRVGTLTATFLLGSLLTWISWRAMLGIASVAGVGVSLYYALRMRERPRESLVEESSDDSSATAGEVRVDSNNRNVEMGETHPFDQLTLWQAIPQFFLSPRFLLIAASLMGLTILWDFLLLAPMYLQDTLKLDTAAASRAASAFPLGSLLSVLAGGFVFDRLDRKRMAYVMAGLLLLATTCLVVFAKLPGWELNPTVAKILPIGLLFLFGLCLSPCYYIPVSVFSIGFGGRHSGFVVSLLDAIGFAATATFYYFGGGIAKESGWSAFLWVLVAVALWSLIATFAFMRREARPALQ